MGSQQAAYGADWFELTNNGATAVDITGWTMDDGSNSFANSVALTGITSIQPGQAVIFIEGDSVVVDNFKTAWFGSSVPSGLAIGTYSGSGIGLSSGGDGLTVFDAATNPVMVVSFGAGTANFTFDNTLGASGALGTLSAVGVNGAFLSPAGEVGSPGVSAVPEPGSCVALLLGLAGTCVRRRRQ
ncbi:MAG: lamin tail domain-containing protein [Planctomycetales bacterium]|nr:lamin tail domain-containing protein [Planctomycetales bacterium]